MPVYSRGRVVLLGDAGYCPSPLTGMGTSLALVGSYILAGEILKHRDDPLAAFREYERILRPFVETAHGLIPKGVMMFWPQTTWGVRIFNFIFWFVSWSGLASILLRFGDTSSRKIDLPDYNFQVTKS
jgi:2-polyprenyl-6-methoxyphenol hydroxylase-like FAD-dependent oxidoreductase